MNRLTKRQRHAAAFFFWSLTSLAVGQSVNDGIVATADGQQIKRTDVLGSLLPVLANEKTAKRAAGHSH
jgi:hypothetical protein